MKNPNEYQIAKAIQNNQKEIIINGKIVELPPPQTSGTESQKKIYAELKGRELLEKHA